MIANPFMIADAFAPEGGGGNLHKQYQSPESLLGGEAFSCLLGLLLAEPAGGETVAGQPTLASGETTAEHPVLAGGETMVEHPVLAGGETMVEHPVLAGGRHEASWSLAVEEAGQHQASLRETGVLVTCASEEPPPQSSGRIMHYSRPSSDIGESCGTPVEGPDVPTRLGLSPAEQARATVMQAQPPTLGETTSAARHAGYDISGLTAGGDRDAGAHEAVTGIRLSGAQPLTEVERLGMGTRIIRDIQPTEMPDAKVISGLDPTVDEGPSHIRFDPVLPRLGARAAASLIAVAEDMHGPTFPAARALRVAFAETAGRSVPSREAVGTMPPAGAKARAIDDLSSDTSASQQSEGRSIAIPPTSLSNRGAESPIVGETFQVPLKGYPMTIKTHQTIASDVREDTTTVAQKSQGTTESESAQPGGNRTADGGAKADGQGSDTDWIDNLLARALRHQGQRATAMQQGPAERTGRSGLGSPEVPATFFQDKGTAIGGNTIWSSNATGSDHSVQQSMISEMIERVTAARANRTREASFEIETEAGETIRVRIALNGRILTGRIGVGDHFTKAMVEGRLWELNQRLESEGFSPQNLGVFILGGGNSQSGKRHYRQSQVRQVLEDRRDKANESTLVEIEARAFDRWA